MSDAMILPCGHTFGAGGIEQVKQMVQSLCLSFTLFYLFSFAYGICFFFGCVLLESLLHLFAASLRRLYHPKSQWVNHSCFMWFECLGEFIFTAIYAALRVAVQAFCREEKSQSNHSSKRKREGFDQVNSILLTNHIDPVSRLITRDLYFHKRRRDDHLVTRLIQIVQGTEPIISLLLWQIEL